MRNTFVLIATAFLAGAAATFIAVKHELVPLQQAPAASPVIENVPAMSRAAAESHRNNQFSALNTVEEILALPGDFAQTEALYALAGRSDSAGVQNLIFQAHGIADAADRKSALDILFARLTELDAPSALALSRTGEFRAERHIEAQVWHSWGKLDLDNALRAAAALDSSSDRNLAAQALYAAYDYQGNDTTDYIADALGIEPDTATRAAYLFRLAERDPAAAIGVINDIALPAEQHEAASYLGRRLGRLDGAVAKRHAALFNSEGARQAYRHAVTGAVAETDPEAVLDELLAGEATLEQTMEAHSALRALASRDIDKALEYLDRIGNPRHRAMLGGTIGQALAQADPDRALAWAMENDRNMQSGLLAGVLAAIAATRPELAIEQAQRLPNAQQRQQAFSMIAMTMSQRDPQRAVAVLDQIERPDERQNVAQSIASTWIRTDPDAALAWIVERDRKERDGLMSMAAHMLAHWDLDSAMRWLPRLDEKSQALWRTQIASNLASQRSPEEASQFISRFEGSEDYPRLLAAAINGVAQSDVAAAIQMANRVPAGLERDALYSGLIAQYGRQEPQQASTLLNSISDSAQRGQATAMLAMVWSHTDPAGAQQWIEGLPRGATRDDAIVNLASNWDEISPSRRLLVNSIGNLEKRKQALMMAVQRIARSNPQQAESLMREMDLSDDERQQLLNSLRMMRVYQ